MKDVSAVGRCEQCGLGIEVLGTLDRSEVTCRDCGGPVYAVAAVIDGGAEVVDLGDEDDFDGPGDPADCTWCVGLGNLCPWHAGWAAGWDQCARLVAGRSYEGQAAA